MIYIGTNWSYRMQRYGATVVLTAIGWVEGRTDRHARRQIDRQAVRQTDIQRANRQTEKQKQIQRDRQIDGDRRKTNLSGHLIILTNSHFKLFCYQVNYSTSLAIIQ